MKRLVTLFATMAALLIAGNAFAEPLPTEEALKERILGNAEAPIEIIEYASLTCPVCARFHNEVLSHVKKDWIDTGKAKIVYRDFPTAPVALAMYGAMVARCAPENRYFKFLDVFYKQQSNWIGASDPMAALAKLARLGGMSQADFDACTKDEDLFTGIRERALDGEIEYGINSTPSFVINGKVIRGFLDYDDFNDVLEDAAK